MCQLPSTCGSAQIHKYSTIRYRVYQLLGPLLNTFSTLPFKVDLTTLCLSFFLYPLVFCTLTAGVTCDAISNNPGLIDYQMFALHSKLAHSINIGNNCKAKTSINIPTPG